MQQEPVVWAGTAEHSLPIECSNQLGTAPVEEKRATPDALATQLKTEIDKWGPIIKKPEFLPIDRKIS